MTQASEEFQATMPRNTLSQRATLTIAEEARASGIAIVPDALFEKFAELIIRECMEHANEIGRLNHGRGSWHSVRDRISIKMLGIYPKSGPIMPTATGVEE